MRTFNNRLRPTPASSHKADPLDITIPAERTWMELLPA
jgi:hypothetical protein